MLWRALIAVEWVLAGLLGMMLMILALELPMAWNSEACSVQPSPHCYHWGPSWAAEYGWHYADKRSYLTSGILTWVIIAWGLLLAFLLRPGRRIFALAGAIAALHASDYLLPRFL